MPTLIQLWVLPQLPSIIGQFDGIEVKPATVRTLDDQLVPMQLLQSEVAESFDAQLVVSAFRRFDCLLQRVAFLALTRFNVYEARGVESRVEIGNRSQFMYCQGTPPGMSSHGFRVGYRITASSDLSLLASPLDDDVKRAISWLNEGNGTLDTVNRVLAFWIGIECLTPLVRVERKCPSCGASKTDIRATYSIKQYVVNELGVPKATFDEYYDLRNKIVHGHASMTASLSERAAKLAFDLQVLLTRAIKQRLGWKPEDPPHIEPEGFTIAGALMVGGDDVVDATFYDRPICSKPFDHH
jgi:hypothetical protein